MRLKRCEKEEEHGKLIKNATTIRSLYMADAMSTFISQRSHAGGGRTGTALSLGGHKAQKLTEAAQAAQDQENLLFGSTMHLLEVFQERQVARSRSLMDPDAMSVYDESEVPEVEEPDAQQDMSASISIKHDRQLMTQFRETRMSFNDVLGEGEYEDALSAGELKEIFFALGRRELPKGTSALRLVNHAHHHLQTQCSTLERIPAPSGRIIVVGDLHGHMGDFWYLFTSYGTPTEDNIYLFNGDYVDRGVWGPEVVLAVFAFKLMYPNYVHLNRGNHESDLCTDVYGFKAHLAQAYPHAHHELYPAVLRAFDMLPLCFVIGNKICVVHGGLPKTQTPCNLEDIAALERGPVPRGANLSDKEDLFQALLWSDPKLQSGKSDRGIGWHFAPNDTKKFLRKNGLTMMIRSHECVESGFRESHEGLVTTVFSSSNYELENNANVAIISSDLKVSPGNAVGWNEMYLKQEWLEDMIAPVFDASVLGEPENYVQFVADIHRGEMSQLGLGISIDHTSLETPVIYLISEGVVDDYNMAVADPDKEIQVGDAMLFVNGRSGYANIIEELKILEEHTMQVVIRRPNKLMVTVKKSDGYGDRKGTKLDPDELVCPDCGFLVVPEDGWGKNVHQFDRIVAVNGIENNGDLMFDEIYSKNELNLELYRYVDPDVSIESVQFAQSREMRKATMRGWGGDAESLQSLILRLGEFGKKQAAGSVKERVLWHINNLVFLNRTKLLENFQLADQAEGVKSKNDLDWDNRIFRDTWAKVMRKVLQTPREFPWFELCPHVCQLNKQNEVSYAKWLMSFRSLLGVYLLGQWCQAARDAIVFKVKGGYTAEFNSLDVDHLGKLSYDKLVTWFQKHLYGSDASSQMDRRHQEIQCWALWGTMRDVSTNGFIDQKAFVRWLSIDTDWMATRCQNGHLLTHQKLGCMGGLQISKISCDNCGDEVGSSEEIPHCDRCNFDLCQKCYEVKKETQENRRTFANKERHIRNEQWRMVDTVLFTLCSSHVHIETVLSSEGIPADGHLELETFQEVFSELLPPESLVAFWQTMLEYFRDQEGWSLNDDKISVKDFVRCLEVRLQVDFQRPSFFSL